ncbi:MAG: hypothetical protein NTV22_04805 [bacterium]|nr:hypothetical protein [bacterium]
MKIFNYTNLGLDRDLWHLIAREFGIDGIIRDADCFDRKELTVVIKQPSYDFDKFTYGFFYPGRIDIDVCSRCTAGTVLLTYMHEALHALLYQLGDEKYNNADEMEIDDIAKAIFTLAGGRIGSKSGCSRYLLNDLSAWKQSKNSLLKLLRTILRKQK